LPVVVFPLKRGRLKDEGVGVLEHPNGGRMALWFEYA
jgi:hypothetical protein